jgi:hypothetical protein
MPRRRHPAWQRACPRQPRPYPAARQAEEAGWIGLAGFVLVSLWFVLVTGYTFFEAFILPLLASDSAKFAESFLGDFHRICRGG